MSWVEGLDCRGGGGVLWAGSLGWWGAGSGGGGRGRPESVGSEVGAERSAGSRWLCAWLGEARIGGRARGEAASFLRAGGPGRRPGAHLCPLRWTGGWPVTMVCRRLCPARAPAAGQPGTQMGGRHPPVPASGEVLDLPGDRPRVLRPGRSWACAMADITRHRPLVCEAVDMAGRRCPYTTGETVFHSIPLGPGLPVHLRPARQAPERLRHSPLGEQDRGALGGCLGGSWRAPPSRNERAYQMVHHRKKQDHPGHRPPLRPSPEQARNTQSETAPPRPEGTGHPARPTRSTEQQDKQPETPPSELSETRPAAQ